MYVEIRGGCYGVGPSTIGFKSFTAFTPVSHLPALLLSFINHILIVHELGKQALNP